jgi:hypothetical protein
MSTILRVKEPFSVVVNGAPFGLCTGDLVSSDEDIVEGREHLFEELKVITIPKSEGKRRRGQSTETATAAPGEVRQLGDLGPKPAAPPVVPQAKKED